MRTTAHPARTEAPGRGIPLRGIVLAGLLGWGGAGLLPAQDPKPSDDVRAALEQWVEVRRVLSQERRDWALGKELLQDRIQMVGQEIELLGTRIAAANEDLAEADDKRAGLWEENERLKATAVALEETVVRLEQRVRTLLPRLPDPVREQVRPLSQKLPEEDAEVRQSLGERFQNVVGILNEVDKFQREIVVKTEVRELSDGTQAEVNALYAGLGQGWYVTVDGRAAAVGRAGPEAWSWTSAPEHAASIARAIAIHRNEQLAAFVALPTRVD